MMLLRTIFVSAVVPNFCQRMPTAMRLASFIRSRLICTEVGIITFYIEARTKIIRCSTQSLYFGIFCPNET